MRSMTGGKDISELRREYTLKELNQNSVDKNPYKQFKTWMDEVIEANITEPNAMMLGTVSKDGLPSVRTVLLKGMDGKGFVFYTNYESDKAKDMQENPNVSLLFFWKELERQVRIWGSVEKTTREESELYFNLRPFESRLGAWASKQSSVIPGRDYLQTKFKELKKMYEGQQVPLPPFWGGYRVLPFKFEFWQGRESRLHDRLVYLKKDSDWEIVRLAP
ncbi:MAG: pyridoxamine 5'-phosphate oxidase [Ignavibacteriaceae bacterium]